MASETFEPSYLEFLEPNINKPEPLRIIKCGKGNNIRGLDDISRYSTRQIIIPGGKLSHYNSLPGSPPERVGLPLKIQKKRKGTSSTVRSTFGDSESSISDRTRVDNNSSVRLSWAGTFAKSELCRWSSDSMTPLNVSPGAVERACKDRKLSRALKSVRSKSMNFLHLNSSESSLSRCNSKITPQQFVFRHSFESAINKPDSKTVYPELSVIPEYDVIGTGDISLWVAVRVIGAYRSGYRSDAQQLTDNSLYDVNIELVPGLDSLIEELYCHNSSVLRFGEAKVVLGRIKIRGSGQSRTSHARQSSEDLIEELETQLGSAAVDYLNIKITYKDSPFPTARPWIAGVSKYSISSVVKARLTMPRLCGHPVSTAMDQIKSMIENSCEPWIARDMINKLNVSQLLDKSGKEGDRLSPDMRCICNCSSDSDTTIPVPPLFSSNGENSQPLTLDSASPGTRYHYMFNGDPATPMLPVTDPARKIWSDLRRSSRGSKQKQISSYEVLSQEQNDIRETALRNRRSIGADTLRSIAPPSTQTRVGFGGRGILTWSWGPPWW